ncbi:MAG: hypothetical protein IKM66_02725 [Clostridia bacterium]|nr:hypothetical protein [Clostridia bacterium]
MKKDKSQKLGYQIPWYIWILGALMVLGSLVVFAGCIIVYLATYDTIYIMMSAIGFVCFAFFGTVMLLPIIQRKKGINREDFRVWQSGVLTNKTIKKDIRVHIQSNTIGMFVGSIVLAVIVAPVVVYSEFSLGVLITALTPILLFGLGIKGLIKQKRPIRYRIEEDKVIGGYVKETFDIIDATTNHLPTKTPVFVFERHGEYSIDCAQIHRYYFPEELVTIIEPGEEVYIIYSNKKNKILYIYRKKYWKLNSH